MNNLKFEAEPIFFVANAITVSRLRHHNDYNQKSRVICLSKFVSDVLQKNNAHDPKRIIIINNRLEDFLKTFFWVFLIKICNKKLIIFHECCWLSLDLAILTLNPKGSFYPYYNLESLQKVDNKDELSGVGRALFFLGLKGKFNFFQHLADNSVNNYTIYSVRKYPSSVLQEIFKQDLLPPLISNGSEKKVLFLLGTDYVPADALRQTYKSVIVKFVDAGWKVAVKGHPNPQFNDHSLYDDKLVSVISSETPAESLCMDYPIAFGCFSTALLKFSKSISVLGMDYELPNIMKKEQLKRINYLKSQHFFRAGQIFFPASEIELDSLLSKIFKGKGCAH